MADNIDRVQLKSTSGKEAKDELTFLLIHGSMHGAWCWYKVVTILQERGYNVTAVDMTSLGKDKTSPDSVATMSQYTEPAIQCIANVTGKVIIVGHSSGGSAISYIMEQCTEKIEKAIFLAASMPLSGAQRPLWEPCREIGDRVFFTYGNGPEAPPTSAAVNLKYAPTVYYNECPKEDITLALSLLLPHPLQPLRESLSLTPERYGRIRRFYIKATKEGLDGQERQQKVVESNPPERVFEIDSDHSPFFSKPEILISILEEIYRL